MAIYNVPKKSIGISDENWIKCGRCNTEFDLNKNNGCPLCGFSRKGSYSDLQLHEKKIPADRGTNYLRIPKNDFKLKSGEPVIDDETQAVGSWGMFNSFFPGKAVSRILCNTLLDTKTESITLRELVNTTTEVIIDNGLTKFRGFPNNPDKESSIGRLVYHFIKTFAKMGLLNAYSDGRSGESVWKEDWSNIEVSLTKEGFEFAELKNKLYDNHEASQILTTEEKKWLMDYLIKIDNMGYREYSILKEIYTFIKEGHNGKDELWDWFSKNHNFREYIKKDSRKANDHEAFEKQIVNLSMTFAAGKLALLRELGFIANKRNDYTILEEMK